MQRLMCCRAWPAWMVLAGLVAGEALASPVINSAVVQTRIFNDIPGSTVTFSDLYPGSITIRDDNVSAPSGFANRHNFRLSENDTTPAVFLNGDAFAFFADVTLTGTAPTVEGGIQISPWWSQDVDGQFMANAGTGEVAVFGGRLPFYSFTGNHGVTYTRGTTVRMGFIYEPNSLTMADPGTIQYIYQDGTGTYTSPVIPFDQGNPAEDPPYGLWGILNDARVGGYVQIVNNPNDPANWGQARFENMVYIPEPASIALIGLAGLALLRRGR